ncbi:MAG TPA: M28 family peptidase [Gemmatimonadaceae bacterium]|nr:M28 family peptidase [Gemmatimonadaceae bacterium]
MIRFSHVLGAAAALGLPILVAAQNPKTQPTTHKPVPTTAPITAADLKTRLYTYAADSMEGRETGTRGHIKATNYIAAQLKALGLKPMGDNGTYFQNVPVVRRALDPSSTITADGVTLHAGTDFLAQAGRGRVSASASPSGQVIYAGTAGDTTPLLSPELAAGKIVLYRPAAVGRGGRGGRGGGGGFGRGGGQQIPGAVAVIPIGDAISAQQSANALHPREGQVQLKGEPGDSTVAGISMISRQAAEQLLGGSLDGMARGTVGKTIKADLKFIDADAPARNVVAAYEGHDPKLKNEWVAMGAHNDHIGIRAAGPVDHDSLHLYAQAAYPIRERIALYNLENHVCGGRQQANCSPATPQQQAHLDSLNAQIAAIHINLDSVRKANGGVRADSISNGADDDGSGTVTLLEIAERFAKEKPNTKRSVLFVWHVAEEKGLWGSAYVTDHPPVPRDSIVAQLNMDMVGRGAASDLFEGGPTYLQLVGGRRVSTELGDLVEQMNKQEKAPFKFDYQYDVNGHPENIYCRSDHFNYARYGIPIVFATTGLHGDYHQVTDEPEYIDYPHMAKIGNFMYTLGSYVADMDHRPKVDHEVGDPKARCQQ